MYRDPVHRNAISTGPVAVALALLVVVRGASADAPLRTDNADVAPQADCKVETWYEGTPHTRSYVAAPACNVFGPFELGAAFARSREEDGAWSNAYALQAKLPLVAKEAGGSYAVSTTIAALHDTGSNVSSAWLNLPMSAYLLNDEWRVHLNVGGLWRRHDADVFTYGIATELDRAGVTWLAEVYHLDNGRPRYAIGARRDIVEGFTVYLSAGRRFGADPDGWLVTAGIKLESPTFLR